MSPSTFDYQPLASQGVQPFDEMLDSTGNVRPHWRDIHTFFTRLGSVGLQRRWGEAERMVRDLGINYGDRDNDQTITHPWRLDPIPFSLASNEWCGIERAVIQRARLLNRLLQDLYGRQQTLAQGLLPPELILDHPHFLRPCHGAQLHREHYLYLYAAELARSPSGEWWVLADRTQTPAGLAYLMQNRIIASRVFPEIFREGQVRRLTDFFDRWRQSLASFSPRPGVKPLSVLLTPGPGSDAYFEQVFLSRYLGCSLVEGADLVVRETRVFLKTLGGLHPVDVILRHLDDDLCDPLELRADSLLGVPGLMQVVRNGHVSIVNALGSGVVQNPALNPFLPELCRQLLGEELQMPPVTTWWCGNSQERVHVLGHLTDLVVRPAFTDPCFETGEGLPPEGQTELRRRIESRPGDYVGHQNVLPSQAPVWNQEKLEPRSVLLRVFVAYDGKQYFVLPGGFCRAASSPRSYEVSLATGGLAKDVWLIGQKEQPQSPALALPPAVAFQRGSADLPSRIADRMFWLGRYSERAEFTGRLLRGAIRQLSLEQGWAELDGILPLLRTLAQQEQLTFAPYSEASQEVVERELAFTVIDDTRPGSMKAILSRLLSNAGGVRDRLSHDTWLTLADLDGLLAGPGHQVLPPIELIPILNACLLRLSAFAGQVAENMTVGFDLRFLELGRLLERATYTGRLVLESLPREAFRPSGRHEVLLETLDCIITYRQRYFQLQLYPLLDLLLADETNPRSLANQLRQIEERLKLMPGDDAGHFVRTEEKLVHEGLSQIRLLDWNPEAPGETLASVTRILQSLERTLGEVAEQLSHRYFSHVRVAASLATTSAVPFENP